MCAGMVGVVLALCAHLGWAAPQCQTELAERVKIPDSDWVVLTEVFKCGRLITKPGLMKIIAEDAVTHQRVELIKFGEETESTVVITNHEIVITVPNLVDIISAVSVFQDYTVSFRFTPKDVPEERRNYQFWVHNPSDPRAKEWCRTKFVPTAPDLCDRVDMR
jgi:hypothetical protein